ncbi:GntR family transcriptional regulator [Aquabacterium sp. J223]|uniref:GntR family transcriptional regulator n=1 Tax=Aquabacterium sp. J223 TaxID=2898431 RepID=UPI0021AD9D14|nr:GntR family transcriptional regulator [Aquabacterium sp. J223]UUX95234.1 GntR family transcriptional regulator [Aquabacterium sp. J223]
MDAAIPHEQRAYIELRDLLLRGELAPGDRLSEVRLAERLGMSRTPIRWALMELEHTGLVDTGPTGGFVARSFTPQDVEDAMTLRGSLEGLAARLAAERGVESTALLKMRGLLRDGLGLLSSEPPAPEHQRAYAALNEAFHALIVQASGSEALRRAIENNNRLPFAGPSAMLPVDASAPDQLFWLRTSHSQHQALVEAIEGREGTRAQAIAEEHARIGRRTLRRALKSPAQLRALWPALAHGMP